MKDKQSKNVFIEGPIPPDKIATSIANHQLKTTIGAHSLFLGQVRADEINGKRVTAIEYSAYAEMAQKTFQEIREAAFFQFDMTCCHIYHSLGKVKAGELCLFVFTSSTRRKVAIQACNYIVEAIKQKVPVFGKELFEDQTHQWKTNQ